MATPAAQRWSKVIDEQEASGLTIREFSRRSNIKPSTLYWWRRRLDRSQSRRKTTTQFLEVVVEEPATSALMLTLPDLGMVLTIDDGTDLGLVRKLVHALC